MPTLQVTKFRAEAEKVNQTLGRFTSSSLDPLFKELGNQPTLTPNAVQSERIQEAIFALPFDRQQKYQGALAVLKDAGFFIGGRPCDPTMNFVRFDMGEFPYVGLDHARQPKLVILKPGSLHHVFDFRWKSTTGNLQSLAKVWTREFVKFRTAQTSPPFNDAMPTDLQFYWGESNSASSGFGRDDHSIKPPKLVCRFPWVAGENVAEQWYQYSLNGQVWHNIPGAAYLLTKGVRQSGGKWVFYFRKSNWAPHNTKAYRFEAEYPLDPPLAYQPQPGQKWNRTNGTESQISLYGKLISNG
ncbi:MAG: hypothetical protein U1F61_08485 [Opitutaceae bacterium]